MESISNMPEQWAKHQALTEAEAFEYAIKGKNPDYNIEKENSQLRQQVIILTNKVNELQKENNDKNEQINRLRETIRRGQEDFCE